MSVETRSIVRFPGESIAARRRNFGKQLREGLRNSESPVIVDLSSCNNLNHEDIDVLLEAIARVAGRDRQLFFAAGSGAIRKLLEITRIASLVPVFDSVEEALASPRNAGEHVAQDLHANQSHHLGEDQ